MKLLPGRVVEVCSVKEIKSFLRINEDGGRQRWFIYYMKRGQFYSRRQINSDRVLILKAYKNKQRRWCACVSKEDVEEHDLKILLEAFAEMKQKFSYEECLKNIVNGKIKNRPFDVHFSYSIPEKLESVLQNTFQYSIKIQSFILPFLASKNIKHQEGAEKLYPVCGLLMEKVEKKKAKNITRLGVYKPEGDFSFPRRYKAKIQVPNKQDNSIEKEVIFYLYGFVEPEKWHFGVITHLFDYCSLRCQRMSQLCLKICERFNGSIHSPIIDARGQTIPQCCLKTRENKKKSKREIDNCPVYDCLKQGAFKEIHPKIKYCCKKYLSDAVTLWEDAQTTKKIGIEQARGWSENTVVVQLEVYKLLGGEGFRRKLLILRGICYNWNDDLPEMHINILTMYEKKGPSKEPTTEWWGYLINLKKDGIHEAIYNNL